MFNKTRYKDENPNIDECGQIVASVEELRAAVIGRRIVKAQRRLIVRPDRNWRGEEMAFVLTLDDGHEVRLFDDGDCCAYTELKQFLLHPELVDHVILGVGTTSEFTRWHIYADLGDILELTVAWSEGNPCYYGYGFDIDVVPIDAPYRDDDD